MFGQDGDQYISITMLIRGKSNWTEQDVEGLLFYLVLAYQSIISRMFHNLTETTTAYSILYVCTLALPHQAKKRFLESKIGKLGQ